MANGDSEKMKCIAATISSFNWKRVVVIYEDDAFGGYSGKLALLSEALHDAGSEIEYRLVLPPLSSVSNPNEVVQDELINYSTFNLGFEELPETKTRKKIIFNRALTPYEHTTASESSSRPWIVMKTAQINSLLKNILSSNFTGLSGEIHFQQRKLSHDPILRIVNVIGKSYNELDFWLPGIGFSKNIGYVGNKSADFTGTVIWPDDSKLVPKGWAIPTNKKPMIIGVPARTAFEKFVKVDYGKHPGQKIYDGFCIEHFL
ncbi:hypothetical protein PVK06_033313 [Gossypium arboreum]|uniref:Receptor ligand binding region domain-containing protein n=1 Tax=Gossypium arboreum TaxID=29729 RepID=A0ABR0ND69_GOSAR|nr:hypothetical protein PVK06_033313 [Gossypium arboreum]